MKRKIINSSTSYNNCIALLYWNRDDPVALSEDLTKAMCIFRPENMALCRNTGAACVWVRGGRLWGGLMGGAADNRIVMARPVSEWTYHTTLIPLYTVITDLIDKRYELLKKCGRILFTHFAVLVIKRHKNKEITSGNTRKLTLNYQARAEYRLLAGTTSLSVSREKCTR